MMGHGNKAILGTVGHPHRREERIDVVDGEESLKNECWDSQFFPLFGGFIY